MNKTKQILISLKKIERCYNDLIDDDDLYDELDKIRSLLKNNPPIKGVLIKLLEVKKAADSGRALISNQGQAMDGYSELANYRAILDSLSY